MYSSALVQLAMASLQCTQKELAVELGVSSTQVSKWKKSGEHMSEAMQEKLRIIAKIGDRDPNFILTTGSLSNSTKWEKLILHLAWIAQENAETGYNTEPLQDPSGHLCADVFQILQEMGVKIPEEFPAELDFDYENDEDDRLGELIELNPYTCLIDEIFFSFNDVYGFFLAYISKLIYDAELDQMDSIAYDIESGLLELAASKVKNRQKFTPKFQNFKYETQKNYTKWITFLKDHAFRAGIPLRAELLNLVYDSHDALGHEAEAESLNINARRIHPDVYMNELLVGMRIIHQVLPAIIEKLGIANEFKLDESDLHLTERD